MPATGLDTVCAGLTTQQSVDQAGWASLIVRDRAGAHNLRALSPNQGIVMNGSLFGGYYDGYVGRVWARYGSQDLSVDTQAQWGVVRGRVNGAGLLDFGVGDGGGDGGVALTFARPAAADVFSCSSGPFAAGASVERGALIARVAAAFNRSMLLQGDEIPGKSEAGYYKEAVTNHYARIVHAAEADGRGYAFPFDDVTPTGGQDQSGAVMDGNPKALTVTVGGGDVGARMRVQEQ